jgi:exopolysaccharide/PEP-CTERM locus tyrosine autokinase
MNKLEKSPEKAPVPGQPARKNGGDPAAAAPARSAGIRMNPTNPCIVTYREPDSPVAEEYRKLKTVLLRMTREDFRNTVMVTSAVSGEGKSVTSANLAVMLAREYGQTVLLIDADLRRPSLHEYLGLAPSYGLADCLEDKLDPARAILKTGIPKLSFMGAGKKVDNPGELLSSYQMQGFLLELKHRYRDRYIVIDTSPILLFAETQAMSALVDGVLVVVKEGGASLKGISQMLDILKTTNVLGIVYNDASATSLDGRYHHHYYHYYNDNRYAKSGKGKR